MCLIAVILAGGMLRGMAPVRALAAQRDGDLYIEETTLAEELETTVAQIDSEETVSKESAPKETTPKELAPDETILGETVSEETAPVEATVADEPETTVEGVEPEKTESEESTPEEIGQEAAPEEIAPKDDPVSGSLTAELGGISKSFSLTVTPLADTRAESLSIANADQLMMFAENVNNGTCTNTDAVLTADIDMSGKIFPGMLGYKGTFNGNGHSIKNLSIRSILTEGRMAGFMVMGTPTVKNLTFISPSIIVETNSGAALHAAIFTHMNNSGGATFERISIQGGSFSGTNSGSNAAHIGTLGSYCTTAVYTDCIVTGVTVTSNSSNISIAGGFGTDGRETFNNCYFSGTLSATGNTTKTFMEAAGSNSFYNSSKCTPTTVSSNITAVDESVSRAPKLAILLNHNRSGANAPWRYLEESYPYLDFAGGNYKHWLDYAMTSTASLSGSGTESSPYLISTADQMAKFMMKVNGGETGAWGKVTANISLSGYRWIPIGVSETRYTGTFDGGAYTISNMQVSSSYSSNIRAGISIGLFAYAVDNAVIRNVILENCSLSSYTTGDPHETVGGIVGYTLNNTKIMNCGVRGTTITKTGSTTYFSAFGGLVGDLRDSSSITDSYFRGTITNGNTGSAGGSTYVGGIAGRQCHADARVSNSYTVATLTNNAPGSKYTAYIIGMSSERTCISNCYYDSTASTSGISNPGNGTAQTTEQMQRPDFTWLLNATETAANGRYYPNQIWNYQISGSGTSSGNGGYPDFVNRVKDWQAYGAVVKAPTLSSGSYQLTKAEDLAWFMSQVNSNKTTLNGTVTAAIDLTGSTYGGSTGAPVSWVSIGKNSAYTGTFRGNKKTISYLSGKPVFDSVAAENAVIDGIVLDNTCKVSGYGGIVNLLTNGTVSNCLNGGTVTSTAWAGGIVGRMADGTVELCGVSGNLISSGSSNTIGGIVGYVVDTQSKVEIKNCYYRDGTMSMSSACFGYGIAYVTVGSADKTTIKSSYFSGSITGADKRYGIAPTPTGITVTDCIYLQNTSNPYTEASYGTVLPSEQLKSWYCAYLLNGKKVGTGTVWTVGQPKGEYPEWGALGAVTNWESVGEIAQKPTTTTVGGASYYIIDSAEDLAWLAYQVNHTDSSGSENYNGLVTADIDLFGGEYTGRTKSGNASTDAAAALPWIPIGHTSGTLSSADAAGTVPVNYYKGTMTGQSGQYTIDYLRVEGAGKYNGLLGYTYGASVSNLAIGEHSQVRGNSGQITGGVAAAVKGGTVTGCENRGAVKVTVTGSDMGLGGIVGTLNGGTMTSCVNRGSITEVDSHWGYSGGIVGYAVTSSTVTDCTNYGTLTYGFFPGGIAGRVSSNSVVKSCSNEGAVTYGESTGGIVGYLDGGKIQNSKNTGQVKAGSPSYVARAGGIAGSVQSSGSFSGIVSNCENTGAVGLTNVVEKNSAGGIAGQLTSGTVEKNRSTGTVSIGNSTKSVSIGGVAGAVSGGTLQNNYSMGSISGGAAIVSCGGVAGSLSGGTVTSNYSAGSNSGSSGLSAGVFGSQTGGTASNNFFDSDQMSGIADSAQKGGRTTAQMKSWGCAYQLNGAPDLSAVSSTVWRKATGDGENSGYPVFAESGKMSGAADWSEPGAWVDAFGTKPLGDGSGTPYQIEKPEELAWLAYVVNTDYAAYGKSSADLGKKVISLYGERFSGRAKTDDVSQALTWKPIAQFSGSLANGELNNLRIPGGSGNVSFIQILDGGQISGLQVRGSISATANQTSRMAGIVALAQNNSGIRYCMNWISINAARQAGNNYTGGIVGQLDASTVEYCANFANISDTNWTGGFHNGGIAGSAENGSTVNSCYNAATANAADSARRAGSGHIVSPRNLNATVTACYYDSDKAGQWNNAVTNVSGLTTAQMKTFRATQLLNTSEHTGSSRIWYTASDAAPTGGYPCFTPTQQSGATFKPIEAAAPIYSFINATDGKFLYLEQVKNGVLDMVDSADTVTLGLTTDITGNYHKYGTDNANANMAFGLGNLELSSAARNAQTGGNQLRFYNAAAYNNPTARYFVLGVDKDGTVYEYTLAVSAVTSKTLNVTLPVNAAIALKPGQEDTAKSNSLNFENKNPYPVDFNISKVTPWETGTNGATHKLMPVAQSVTVTGDEAYQEKVHLWLENVSYGGYLYKATYYYDPAKGTIPFGGKLGASGSFSFRYSMDYGAVLSGNNGVFGYDVIYEYSISKEDADKNSVAVGGK